MNNEDKISIGIRDYISSSKCTGIKQLKSIFEYLSRNM